MQPTYAKRIEVPKRDVIRARSLDFGGKFLPDGLTRAHELAFLSRAEKRTLSHVQGRTYANMFAVVERFIGPKVRFTDEALEHQELFRRMERMSAAGMPHGYAFLPQPNHVAALVLNRRSWAVLALICHMELFVLAHYRQAIEPDAELSPLWKDVFAFHAREESQHALLDELEWRREDAKLTSAERDAAVDDLIGLVAAVDGLLQSQARADALYFMSVTPRMFSAAETARIGSTFLAAYRWQYIASGVEGERFQSILAGMVTPAQMQRIGAALAAVLGGAS